MPLSNEHNKYTKSNNISSDWRNFSITSPGSRIIYICNFHYLQIIHTSNHSISQSNCNQNIKSRINSVPKNSCFSLKTINWRKPSLTSHKHCPSKSCSSRTSILAFQIPQVLWSCTNRKLLCSVGLFCIQRKISSHRIALVCSNKKRNRSVNWPKQHTPNSSVNNDIDNHVSPKYTNRISGSIHKVAGITIQLLRTKITSALRHKKNPHMTNATISQQTFNIGLSLGCNSSNNHGECSKQNQSITVTKGIRSIPNCMPVVSPKSKHCNFRLYCNPLRYTGPCTHVNVWYPKVQRSYSLFPKQSNRNKPNTKSSKQRRIISSSLYNFFNMGQRSFSSLPINKAYPLKQLTASKSTQLKVFHSCLQGICTFRVQTTKNNQRKTLQFHAEVQGHQICRHDQQILTNLSLQSLVDILCLTNSSYFLPSIRHSLDNCPCKKLNSSQLQTITIFLETSSQKNEMQRTRDCQLKTKKTPSNCPQCLCRYSMIRSSTSIWGIITCLIYFAISFLVSTDAITREISILISYSQNFCYWTNKIPSTLPKQNKETKEHKKLRSKKNQIQGHLYNLIAPRPSPLGQSREQRNQRRKQHFLEAICWQKKDLNL